MTIMLDECITHGPAQALISFFALADVEAYFLVNYFGTHGLKDADWPRRLPKEKAPWYVITADRDKGHKTPQKRQADGPPLHTILPALGITAAYLSGKLQQSKGDEKVRAIVCVWPDLRKFFGSSPARSRVLITKRNSGFDLRPNF